ncbi:hypothetical protein BLNAU_5357 [Blattamonas nauphoetae]|uniref:Uncharacterized protein n=1 Tax=Blattamonas nauphoetae TaxID=2049346 RepID=A0ABQ9Y7C9_9EUKA|nr:hypothetical protein BLNAU_5357 [Blattamonas nauphoetae]
MTVTASELAISDSCLTFGTGPLIGFGCGKDKTERGGEQAVLPRKVSTLLSKSQIVNTTSKPSDLILDQAERTELTQRVMGSSVCLSTNHLCGTAEHFKSQQTSELSTNFFKLCTFKDCSTEVRGAAIHLDMASSLRIEDCSFQTCLTTSQYSCGGAVHINISTGATFMALSSSFVGCSSASAGSMFLQTCPSSTLINCVFIDSQASEGYGGCIGLLGWDPLSTSSSITNCLFENCRTTSNSTLYTGGALLFTNAVSVQLNFVNFRGNKGGINPSNDILIAWTTPLITSETMVGCTSTSDSPRLRVFVSCMGAAIDSETAEFNLTISETITGTVLVLLDNSGGIRQPGTDDAPNIGRVLSFSLDNSIESKCSVSLGEDGLVQTPLTDYKVVKSSFVGSVVLSANCVLDKSKKTALITLSGSGIPSGILSATLSDNTVLDFPFLPQQTTSEVLTVRLTEDSLKFEVGEPFPIVSLRSNTHPSQKVVVPWQIKFGALPLSRLTTLKEPSFGDKQKTVSVNLEGVNLEGTFKVTLSVNETSDTVTIEVLFSLSEGQLRGVLFDHETPTNMNMSYNTRFEVVGVTKDGADVNFDSDLSFTTIPEPPRLLTMECEYDEAIKTALFRMTGQVLETTKKYEIELNDSGNSKKTIEMTFNTKSSEWEGSVILYSPGGSVELEYGKTYSVSRELKDGLGKIGVGRGNSKWTSDTEIVSGSDLQWKAEFLVGFSESTTVLKYGETYTLCGLEGSAFFVNDGISITVPRPPAVTSMIPKLNTDTHSSFRVVMSGSHLPAIGSFTASFSESAGTFVISFSESSAWSSDWIVVSPTSLFEFNKTYTLTSLIDSSSGTPEHLLCSGVTMSTPLGPTLTGLGAVSLTGTSLDSVRIVVNVARIIADTFQVSMFDVEDEAKVPIPLSISFSSCDSTEGAMTHSVSWDSALLYGHRYEIASMSSSTMAVSIPSQLVFAIPLLSSFDNVFLTHNSINTSLRIEMSGNGLMRRYAVTLTSGFSFAVTAQSVTSAVSEEIALGWPDGLSFDTPFTVESIVSTNQDSNIDMNGTLSFTTPKKPDPLVLNVDGRTGDTSRFCGESTRPCSSVEVAWEIVCEIGVRTPTIGIVHSATLGSPIRIENGMVALLSNLGNVEPTLRISSSTCEKAETGMIVVSSSTLEIRDVDILIDSLSPSFVLSAQNSTLTLKEGSFVGPQSTPSSNDELSEEICSWTNGILQLDNCTTSISDTKLNHLSFGAVNMKAGSLKVETSSFHDNSPNLSHFPSLRRNIHCSDGGHLEIGSLSGGDGVGDKMGWFSRSDCTLSGDGVDVKTAFFAPTLSTDESMSMFAKKTETFVITIVGTTLIPCGLKLDVFEKSKDGTEGQSRSFELNLNSTTSFSEKVIVLSLSESSLPTFSKSLEWRGRLRFGRDLHTADSFVIQPNSSDRFAQAMKDNMKWWIPVVVVVSLLLLNVIVIVVVCIRRNQKKGGDEKPQPLSEMEEQIEVKIDEDGFGTIAGEESTQPIGELVTGMDQLFGPPTKEGQASRGGNDADVSKLGIPVVGTGEGVAETTTLQKYETLYDKLHTTEQEVNKKAMIQSIVCGLQNAARINSTAQLCVSDISMGSD